MSFFVCLKQITDLLYRYSFLDYLMVVFVIVLLGLNFIKEKQYKEIKRYQKEDILVLALMVLYFISFLHDTSRFSILCKVESGFLVYFLGRSYGGKTTDIKESAVSIVGYFIIYANLIYRFYEFGFRLILKPENKGLLNSGHLYYYKTDMAIGILFATTFIYLYSKNKYLKYITIFPIAGYMIFYSGARTEMLILAMLWIIIIGSEIRKKKENQKHISAKTLNIIEAVIILCLVLLLLLIQVLPLKEILENEIKPNNDFYERIFHGRHIIWMDILVYFQDTSIWKHFMGVDLASLDTKTITGMRAHSHYIRQLYSVGYCGVMLFTVFVINVFKRYVYCEERKNKLLVLIAWVIFLAAGLSTESIEFTQISWFAFLYAGAVVTSNERK